MKNIFKLAALALPVILTGCAAPSQINTNEINQNQALYNSGSYNVSKQHVIYTNQQMKFSVTLPQNWKVVDYAGLQELAADDQLTLLKKSNNNKLVANYLENRMREDHVRLFLAFSRAPHTTFNKVVSISAQRRSVFDPDNLNDLRSDLIDIMKNSPPEKNVTRNANFPLATIGGKQFVHFEVDYVQNNTKYNQDYYIRIEGQYNLQILIGYPGPKDNQYLNNILSSIQFNSSN